MDYIFHLISKWNYKKLSLPYIAMIALSCFVGLHVVLWWLWNEEFWAIVITLVLLFTGLALFRSWKLVIVVVAVAIGGTLQDFYFINSGLWAYMGGSGSNVPGYIPIVWGLIAMLLVVLYKAVWIVLRKLSLRVIHRPPQKLPGLLITLSTLLLALFALAQLSSTPLVLIGVFLLISFLYLLFMRSVPLAIVSVVTLIFGALGELIGVAFGAWEYSQSTLGGVPLYIFFGWDIIGAIVVGTYIALGAPDSPPNRKV